MTHFRKGLSVPERKLLHVYIMANGPCFHVLYTCVTGYLSHRVFEQKTESCPAPPSRYNLTRLVYCECFVYPDAAISREKATKAWWRSKKIQLNESMNPRTRSGEGMDRGL